MLKFKSLLVLVLISLFSFSSYNASIVGKWKMEVPDGVILIHFMEDGKYTVDLGNDGSIDVYGNYEWSDGQITVQDYDGERACPPDAKGVYSLEMEGNTLTMTRISDECDGRGGDGAMSFTRAE